MPTTTQDEEIVMTTRALVDVAETVARCLPSASERFSFLLALGSREIRDTILLNEYTYRGASFSVGRKRDDAKTRSLRPAQSPNQPTQSLNLPTQSPNQPMLPPRWLLEAAGSIHVHGNALPLTALKREGRAFRQLTSLSLTGVHVSAADVRSISRLELRALSVRDSQLDVSIHALISLCEASVESLELESVLCCCGTGPYIRGQRVRDNGEGDGDNGDNGEGDGCVHAMARLEHLSLLGNVRCARRSCSCRITGGVRRVRLAKADDSVVEARGLRELESFCGFWSRSWMLPATSGCLRELWVEGDIDADDLLAVLASNAGIGVVRIGGEVQRLTSDACRALVGAARRGVVVEL